MVIGNRNENKNVPIMGALSSWTPWFMASVHDGLCKSCATLVLVCNYIFTVIVVSNVAI